jgi:membrane fusion protein, hemolysin D
MTNTPIVDLADCTLFRQTLEARPPRIVHGTAVLLSGLVAAALIWAHLTTADLIVRGGGRVRPIDSPYRLVNPVHGEALSASAGGRVIEVKVKEGDEVKKGDVLVRFDTERLANEIQRQEQKLRLAEEELAKFAQMDQLQTKQFEATRAKAEAERNLLLETLKRNKERQTAEAKEIEVELVTARDDEARLRLLVDRRAAARADLIAASTRRQALENRLERARVPAEEGQLETARQSLALLERDNAIRQEELNLKRSAKQTEVQSAKLELVALTKQRDHAVLRAPIDGVVAWADVKVGELVPQGKVILEVAEEKGFIFEAVVPSEEIGHLQVGMPARVKLDAFDYQKYGVVPGTVQFISPDSGIAQTANGAPAAKGGQSPYYVVRIALESDEFSRGRFPGRVKLGMAGHVEIVTEQESLLTILVRKVRQSISLG